MKTLIALSLLFSALSARATDLKVTLDNFNPAKGGVVQVALYIDNGMWLKKSKDKGCNKKDVVPYKTLTLPMNRAASFTIAGLNPNRYALAVIHDANQNCELDQGLFGIPKEGYGFSKVDQMMPPKFNEAAFAVSGAETSVHVKIRYKLF